MSRGLLRRVVGIALGLAAVAVAWAQEPRYPIMKPDRATRAQWITSYREAPRARIDARVPRAKGSFHLLDRLQYVPAERNQGRCGNCWCWAGLGCMEVALFTQHKVLDRLSVQYVNSSEKEAIGKDCCRGGWLQDIAKFFSTPGYQAAVPWSNAGAHWQDGDAACRTPASSIAKTPNYPVKSIQACRIPTQDVPKDEAIANIQNVLNQGQAVWFGWFLPTEEGWNKFFDFWDHEDETSVTSLDHGCGLTWEQGGGGHAVLCVGYDDSDPKNRYWLMLNSWGTANGKRPKGLFRLAMDMDYGCWAQEGETKYYNYYWQSLDMQYALAEPGEPAAQARPWRPAFPIMQPDRATRSAWIAEHNRTPRAATDPRISRVRGAFNLLNHLKYVPAERNQGACGNCWIWAGVGCMEVALDVQEKVLDRLSIQFVNSKVRDVIGKPCCQGGWLNDLAKFFSAAGNRAAIPWSNSGAHWQDGNAGCQVPASSIATQPQYPIRRIESRKIDAYSTDKEKNIADIQNILNQGKAIWFAWFLPTAADWDRFFYHWTNDAQTVTLSLDHGCGHTWEEQGGGGHAVLCVGYDDTDPNNRYWLMLNSWGTARGQRPDGLFRLTMDMDYRCWSEDQGNRYASYYWQCLDMAYDLSGTGVGQPPPPGLRDETAQTIETTPGGRFTLTTPAGRSTELFLGSTPVAENADLHLLYTGQGETSRLGANTFASYYQGRWAVIGRGAAPQTFGKVFRLQQATATPDGVIWTFQHTLKAGETADIYQRAEGGWVRTHTVVCR